MGLLGFRCHTNANRLIQDKVYILENIYKSVITNNVRSFLISHWINHCSSLIRVWGKNITQGHPLAGLSQESLSGSERGSTSHFLDGSCIHDMGNLQGEHISGAELGQRDLFSLLLS